MKIQGAVLAIALLAIGAQAREPDVRGYKAYEMPAYTIVTPDERNAARIAWPVAQSEAVLAKLFDGETTAPGAPTYVFLMPVSVWRRYLQPGVGLNGEFVPARFANYLLLCATQDESALKRLTLQQAAHWNLQSRFRGIVPMWFDEGVALIVAAADFRNAEVVLGQRPGFRSARGWIPMSELLSMDKGSRSYLDLATTDIVLTESWALVHRGLIFDPSFGRQMMAFIAAQNSLAPLDTAVQSNFGVTLDQLDRDMSSYASRLGFEDLDLKFQSAPVAALPPGRAMSEAEALEFIGEVMLASGFKPLRLSDIANALLRVPDGKYAEFTLRMRIAARDGDDVSLTKLSAAIDQHTIDPAILRGAGLALYERSAETRRNDQSVRALELLDRALNVQPDDAEAVWAYATLAARLNRDLPIARDRVAAASTRWPSNPYLAQAEALVREAGGDTAAANDALNRTLRLSKTVELSRWARQRLGLAPGK